MPKTSIDFNKTVIYKIHHIEKPELLYVGSTINFTQRKYAHKRNCDNTNNHTYNLKLYKTIRDNGGWDMFNMVVVKEFPCENKRQAEAEEDRCIREMKASLNTQRAFITPEERVEYMKQYILENKDKIKEKTREYYIENQDKYKQFYIENKDEIKEKNKKWKLENRDKLCKKNKEWRDRNKEKNYEKFECPCGGKYTHLNKARHFKTKLHQNFLKNNP